MVKIDKLRSAGIDVDGFLKRLMGNEKLVSMFVGKFLQDNNFAVLVDAFKEKDMKKAEVASHTLKGMCGNMSLTELFELFSTQVNLIRAGEFEKAEEMMTVIGEKYTVTMMKMKEWLDGEE